ncbi:TonB-dependent receptor [Chitinophaga qingshengii]|uniref:TonB-dependent receptor n=1 Tax=Chitinophaga qingshengii TaxID=1569794 RepID=A0ABR7TGX6_9BACT|nr:TonB-dependent receptor [Chitinophaga qingshengii]MBC9929737.1 TonB-dependent receptor [Chitinophaga qingshengii]
MKLTALLLVVFLQVNAIGYSQEISLSGKQMSLEKIFRAIEHQSNYRFFYDYRELKTSSAIDADFRKASVPEVLNACLKGQPFTFTIEDKMIVISRKPEPPATPAVRATATNDIRGTVKDEQGNPIPGVSVGVVGTTRGAVTDAKGAYVLNATAGETLKFSILGYKPYTVQVGNANTLDVILHPEASAISEVVVVGYGTQKKSQLIGSVSQINAEKVNNRTVPQLSNALTGQMPGVTVIQRSGRPGNAAGEIQVRGVGSFGATPAALVLVDGMPVNSFNDVNPNDVEAVSVLKDASSAAIYGARAANGVILVTTKSGGATGKLKLNYNGYLGTQKPTALPQSVNSWEYAQAMNEAVPGSYSPAEIQMFKDGSNPDNYPNSNFYGEFFKPFGIQTGHNISLANGNKVNQYQLSFGYLRQNGIVKKNNYDRYNVRLNLLTNINSKLKLTTRIASSLATTNEPAPPATLDFNSMLDMIGQVVRYSPIYPIHMSNGDWGAGINGKGTPVSNLESESFFKQKGIDLNGNLRLDWNVVEGLKLSAIGGGYINYGDNKRFLATQYINTNTTLAPSTLTQNTYNSNYKTMQALAEYNKRFDKHSFNLLAGYSFEEFNGDSLSAFRRNFPGNSLTSINLGSADGQTNDGGAASWALSSFFGRLQYNFNSKYFAEGVLRYDGSSRFPATKKYAFFPAMAVGWRISEEPFMKNNVTWVDELKLKASRGTLGNQNIANYGWQNIMTAGTRYNYSFGDQVATGVTLVDLADPTLRWESTRSTDVGVDFTLLHGLLTGSATYFDKYTYDILVSPGGSVSKVLGFNVGVKNSGKLKNTGWEFTLGHHNTIGKFGYSIDGNFSIINNKVLDVGVGNVVQPNGLVGNANTPLFIGYPVNAYYGYVADGLFSDANEAASWADQSVLGSQKKPGDIRYKDISGPDGKPDGKITPAYDRVVLGSNIPRYTFGLNLGARYHGFDLSVLMQGVTGVKGRLDGYAGFALNNTATVQRWQFDERWTPENPDPNAKYPRMELIPNTGTGNTVLSSYWLLNASYLRIKNMQLGYTLSTATTRRLGIEGLRVSLAAENLITFSGYRKGWDPEVNSGGAYYPILRNYTLGLNVSF